MSLVGSTLGKYQVLEELGRGGMAVVYKGYNPALQRPVALKVLLEELAADQEFVKRFIHEARTAAQLKHPNIATVYDVEQQEDADRTTDVHYIVMEFLPGRTLQRELQRRDSLPLQRSVEIVRALAAALDHAHRQGLTHRDVKPSNVMIGPDGQVTLMDFGIVKAAAGIQLTREGMRIGTPEYMSPEQARGKKVDRRSDIYSLGVVLYEILVGRAPFQATKAHEVLHDHVQREPPPPSQFVPDLSPAVEKVVLRALAKRPGRRFQTAGQLAAALEQAVLPSSKEARGRRREPKLKLVAADDREFHLTGIVGLGRSADNLVRVPDPKISRHHAQIRCDGTRCQIVDLGSVNGTFVNGELLRPNAPRLLRPGDRVRLGAESVFAVGVGTAVERLEQAPEQVSFGSTLRQIVWADRRSRAIALLGGGIVLILLVLCLVTLVGLSGGEDRATLAVVNATGQDLELEIGGQRWVFAAGQRRIVHFPPGEYDYTITLDSGEEMVRRGAWRAGDNGELQIVAGEP